MKIMRIRKSLPALMIVLALLVIPSVWAAQYQLDVVASYTFGSPMSLQKNSDIDFGTVTAGTSESYAIGTDGTVTAANDQNNYLYGPSSAGDVTITGSGSQTISISVDKLDYFDDNGVTPHDAVCTYDGQGDGGGCGVCFPPTSGGCFFTGAGAPGPGGKTLLIGVNVDVDGSQNGGTTAAPTFVVTVVYE